MKYWGTQLQVSDADVIASSWRHGWSKNICKAGDRDAHGVLLDALAAVTPADRPWVSIYWLFVVATFVMAVLIALLRLPVVQRTAEEAAGTFGMYAALLRNPMVWLPSGISEVVRDQVHHVCQRPVCLFRS